MFLVMFQPMEKAGLQWEERVRGRLTVGEGREGEHILFKFFNPGVFKTSSVQGLSCDLSQHISFSVLSLR